MPPKFGLMIVRGLQLVVMALGLSKRRALIVYKVDRMGDWVLAYDILKAIARNESGDLPLIIVSRESRPIRQALYVEAEYIELAITPRSFRCKLEKFRALLWLVFLVRTDKMLFLTHNKSVARTIAHSLIKAEKKISYGPQAAFLGTIGGLKPRELMRHEWVMQAAGFSRNLQQPFVDPGPIQGRSSGRGSKIAIVSPFGSSTLRDWTIEGWERVLRWLEEQSYQLQIWVDAAQNNRARELVHLCGLHAKTTVIKCGTINELQEAMIGCDLVLSVETVTAHLAVALDAYLVCILGGGHFGEFAPYKRSSRQVWLYERLMCYGCNWNCIYESPHCLSLIAPEIVLNTVKQVLAGCDVQDGIGRSSRTPGGER